MDSRKTRLIWTEDSVDTYVISLDEVFWGGLLIALTMAIHGMGMLATLRVTDSLNARFEQSQSFVSGIGIIILASLLIVLTNLVEVILWSTFFVLQGASPNHSVAVYDALLNYSTLQAGYLPQRWRLLEGLLGMAGLLTMAWSTGVLYMLADDFQQKQMRILKQKRESHSRRARAKP